MIENVEEKEVQEEVNPLTGAPEGVDLSEPIEVPEGAQISDINLVKTEEDLINLTVQRILELDDEDPIYDSILEGIASKAKLSWYNRGDYEVFKLYIRKYPASVFKHFEDLRELRVQLKRDKLKKNRRKK